MPESEAMNAMDAHTIPTLEWLREKREQIFALAAKYGVSYVRVFGSVARGDATPESDVDLLVAAGDGVTMFDLVALWLDLKALLMREVSLLTDDDELHDPRRARFMQQVRKESVPL